MRKRSASPPEGSTSSPYRDPAPPPPAPPPPEATPDEGESEWFPTGDGSYSLGSILGAIFQAFFGG